MLSALLPVTLDCFLRSALLAATAMLSATWSLQCYLRPYTALWNLHCLLQLTLIHATCNASCSATFDPVLSHAMLSAACTASYDLHYFLQPALLASACLLPATWTVSCGLHSTATCLPNCYLPFCLSPAICLLLPASNTVIYLLHSSFATWTNGTKRSTDSITQGYYLFPKKRIKAVISPFQVPHQLFIPRSTGTGP